MRHESRETVRAVRLVIYDGTQLWSWPGPGLSLVWALGARLYRAVGWIDCYKSARNWHDALRWAATVAGETTIDEIQFWGHGKSGCALIGTDSLDVRYTYSNHPAHPYLCRIRERLSPNGRSLFWFRTCETFLGYRGQQFAAAWAGALQCHVAGHTHMIGVFQSGLCLLGPGQTAYWPPDQGLAAGTPHEPERAMPSTRKTAHTIVCIEHRVPEELFSLRRAQESQERAGEECMADDVSGACPECGTEHA